MHGLLTAPSRVCVYATCYSVTRVANPSILFSAATFFSLMLYKFFTGEAFRFELSEATRNPLAKWTEVRRFSPLLYLLLRDGTTYFAMYVLSSFVLQCSTTDVDASFRIFGG